MECWLLNYNYYVGTASIGHRDIMRAYCLLPVVHTCSPLKHTTLGRQARHGVCIDLCITASIKLLTLNILDNTKLAVFEHQISPWNIISICFILHIPVELELFLWLVFFVCPCMPGMQRYEVVDISSWAAFNIGKMHYSHHSEPLVPT